jgi:hypothetical protein
MGSIEIANSLEAQSALRSIAAGRKKNHRTHRGNFISRDIGGKQNPIRSAFVRIEKHDCRKDQGGQGREYEAEHIDVAANRYAKDGGYGQDQNHSVLYHFYSLGGKRCADFSLERLNTSAESGLSR